MMSKLALYNNYSLSDYYIPQISFDLTHLCNRRCSYCYINDPDNKTIMSLSTFKNIIDHINNMDIIYNIHLLGGEPTLLDNLIDYVQYLQSDNINEIVIMSNGYRYDDYFVQFEGIPKLHIKFTYHPEHCNVKEFFTRCITINDMAFNFSTIIMINSEQYLDDIIWLYNKLKEMNIKSYIKMVYNDKYTRLLQMLKQYMNEDDYTILYFKTEECVYKSFKPLIYTDARFNYGNFYNWLCKKYTMIDILPNTLLKLSCSDITKQSALSKKFWNWYKLNWNKYYICTNTHCTYCTCEIPKYMEM